MESIIGKELSDKVYTILLSNFLKKYNFILYFLYGLVKKSIGKLSALNHVNFNQIS